MSEPNQNTEPQRSPWLDIWLASFSRLAQAGLSFSPEGAPPEIIRQIRAGVFQALGQSWDEYLRSPQFMQSMKELMDNAIAFRKLNTEFLSKARHELGGVAQDDLDAVAVSIRRLESRLLQRVDSLSAQIAELSKRVEERERLPEASRGRRTHGTRTGNVKPGTKRSSA